MKIYMEFFEEDEEDVRRIFKPVGFLQFQNGADTRPIPIHPIKREMGISVSSVCC